MTTQELRHDMPFRDLELPAACAACDGPMAVRFAPGSAVGVCLGCRRIAAMSVERSDEGLRVLHLPAGLA